MLEVCSEMSVEGVSCLSSKLTKNVLLDVLCNISGCNQVIIDSINFGPEAKKGDSYLSAVTKFTVKSTGKCKDTKEEKAFEVHIIAKSIPTNIARRKTFRSTDFFYNEIAFYEKVWPVLNKFQKSKNPNNSVNCIPTCFSSYTDGINDYIALEDVSFQGFQTLERGSGLNFEQAKIVIQVFARFHALCFAYKDQHPAKFEEIAHKLMETYYDEKFRNWYAATMAKFCEVVRDAVKRELPVQYMEKLEDILKLDLYGEIIKICTTRGPLAVITHGDCWAPNFLTKRNTNNEIIDVIMIDFQLARYSSLVMDIMFFMNTCLDYHTSLEKWDLLIEYYQKIFTTFANELGSCADFLTIDVIKQDMKRCGIFGFGMSMEAIIMSLMEDEDVADINMIKGEEAVPLDTVWIINPIKNKEKRERVANFFKLLVDRNII